MDRRTITDAADLKALAHPLRMDILEALHVRGPSTATQLAAYLDESPSNCSWHLRKLADHGFVAEDEGARGRSRPWKVVAEALSWGKEEAESETSAAGHALTELLLAREVQRLLAAQRVEHLEPAEWREATTLVQSGLWLTAEEAAEVSAQLQEILMTHVDRLHHPERRPEGARLFSAVGWLTLRPDLEAAADAPADDVPADDVPGAGKGGAR